MITNDERGFTLVEVLIVIVILGVLATVVVFAVGGAIGRSEEASCGADRRTLATAIEAYYAQTPNDAVGPTPPLDGQEYERTLVESGFLQSVSKLWDIDGAGAITAAPDGPC